MSFGQFNDGGKHGGRPLSAMADINVTPMVDVMLVLLVIFILAAPLLTSAIRLDLPQTRAGATAQPAASIQLAFDAAGSLYWNQQRIAFSELESRLAAVASQQPELQLRADKSTRYEIIARVMAAAQAQGLGKIAFVTENRVVKP
ncbi:MAG: biopolymer transporter ExbD [Burkholderiales bacterium]|nr:biopolymer transporter ExbD [Burkholderiales bacterium]